MVKFRKSLDSLAGKLILTVGILMSVGSLLFGFIFYKYEERVTLGNLTNHARFSMDLVRRGLHNEMLTGEREHIQKTIEILGSATDVREIKVIGADSRVVFSSDPGEVGRSMARDPDALEALRGRDIPPHIASDRTGASVLTVWSPIMNEPSCYTAACHFHDGRQGVLGALLTTLSASAIETASRRILLGTLVFGGVFVALISVFLCIILYHFVSKPVALLEEGMKRLARGEFDRPIEVQSRDEMGLLAASFNSMTQDIQRYRQRMEDWTHQLQAEVDRKTAEIMKAHEQLIDAEKLASLGRLAAGVAHELNSPLTGIVTFAHLLKERTPASAEQDHADLDVIIEQASRCSKIIKGLLGFSRKGTAERMPVNVNDVLESSISMLRNQSNFHNIDVRMRLDPTLPQVVVDPNQMQQVILNIVTNAADALNERGRIDIATRIHEEGGARFIEMEITDNGPGIIPEQLGRIFEPFFTTKPVGKGTGLGLPVSYGIVKRHGGDILVRSRVGQGTTFTVRLPIEGQD